MPEEMGCNVSGNKIRDWKREKRQSMELNALNRTIPGMINNKLEYQCGGLIKNGSTYLPFLLKFIWVMESVYHHRPFVLIEK